MKDLIKVIEQIPSKEGRLYWIKALKISNCVKGRLIFYFNLS